MLLNDTLTFDSKRFGATPTLLYTLFTYNVRVTTGFVGSLFSFRGKASHQRSQLKPRHTYTRN